jgi:hypothetical protein
VLPSGAPGSPWVLPISDAENDHTTHGGAEAWRLPPQAGLLETFDTERFGVVDKI